MQLQPEFESMSRPKLQKLQFQRLQKLLENVYEKVPFYRQSFDKHGVKPSDLKSLQDLQKFPFTYKQDLRDNYPFNLALADKKDFVRIHASSGTTGKPTVMVYTQNDLQIWSDVMGRSLTGAGITSNDIVQVAFGYGLFTGGLGAHCGGERINAAVIPASGGNSKRQITLLKDLGVNAICCTPSYILSLLDTAKELNIDIHKDLKLRTGVFGAEPWGEEMRQKIEQGFNIKAIDIYGLSEIIGPGVACECREAQHGMHVNEDHFLIETINPETGEVLPPGEQGEIVFTTISKTGMPLIRYRTRDITRLITEPCACGRTFHRMQKVIGRSDDMLIIRGVNVFPTQIESVLMQNKEVAPHYMIFVSTDEHSGMDKLEVQIELNEEMFSDITKNLQHLESNYTKDIKDIIGISCKVRLVEKNSLQRFEGKAQRVIDTRKKK